MTWCRRIKQAPLVRDTPLIMLTAREDRAAMLDGFGAGAKAVEHCGAIFAGGEHDQRRIADERRLLNAPTPRHSPHHEGPATTRSGRWGYRRPLESCVGRAGWRSLRRAGWPWRRAW